MADESNNQDQNISGDEIQSKLNEVLDTQGDSGEVKSTFSFAELYEKKDEKQEFIIPELLPDKAVALLVGEDGIGKTQILIQLCLAICLKHTSFLLQDLRVKHNRTLFCATEDSKEQFTKAMVKQAVAMKPDLNPDEIKLDFTEGSNFDDFKSLMKELERKVKQNPYDLIIIDALSDIFLLTDGNINDSGHARLILQALQNFCGKHETTIIVIHHVAKTKMDKKRDQGKLFIEKTDTQGAGSITQKPRTVWALTHLPKKRGENITDNTNFLHVVKKNAMGNYFQQNAIRLNFDGNTLLHTYLDQIDINAYENPDGTQDPNQALENAKVNTERALTYDEHIHKVKEAFGNKDKLVRSDLVRALTKSYDVGKNKVEQSGGVLNTIKGNGILKKSGNYYIINPTLTETNDIKQGELGDDKGEDAPF